MSVTKRLQVQAVTVGQRAMVALCQKRQKAAASAPPPVPRSAPAHNKQHYRLEKK